MSIDSFVDLNIEHLNCDYNTKKNICEKNSKNKYLQIYKNDDQLMKNDVEEKTKKLQIFLRIKMGLNLIIRTICRKIKLPKILFFEKFLAFCKNLKKFTHINNKFTNNIKQDQDTIKNKKNLINELIVNSGYISIEKIEKHMILNDISFKLLAILKIHNSKYESLKQKSFYRWITIYQNNKKLENLKNELEKKINNKYETKLKEMDKTIKYYENEYKEMKQISDDFIKKYTYMEKTINTYKEQETEYLMRSKIFLEEKKNLIEILKDLKNEISIKYEQIENYIKQLDSTLLIEKDYKNDKEIFLDSYINEMNALLDYYENKSCEINILNKQIEESDLSTIDMKDNIRERSISDSKRKMKNDSQNHQNKSSSKKKIVTNSLKNAKNLYIKNPYGSYFSNKNQDNISAIKSNMNNNFLFSSINAYK